MEKRYYPQYAPNVARLIAFLGKLAKTCKTKDISHKRALDLAGGLPAQRAAILTLVLLAAHTMGLGQVQSPTVSTGLVNYTSLSYTVGMGPEALAFDGVNIWLANWASYSVTKLRASTGAVVGTYPVGSSPGSLAFYGTNMWVANFGGSSVTKLLASTGATVNTYPVGGYPVAVAFDGTNIWVASSGGCCASNTMTKLLASTGAVVGTYPLAGDPQAIAFDGTNIWVVTWDSSSPATQQAQHVTKLLAVTGATMGAYPVGGDPYGIVFDGTNIWVANSGTNNVTKLLASTGAILGNYAAGSFPAGIAFDGTNIWVANSNSNSVTKLLASTGATLGNYPVGGYYPWGVLFDGTSIWVANENSNNVTKISPQSSLAFGNQLVGLTSATQAATITYSGTAAFSIAGIAITGANSADYAQTNTCGSSGAVTSCVISVAFTPTAPGTRTASISITDNASNSPQTITLTGTGQVPPTVSVASSSLEFGRYLVGSTSATQTTTITNSSTSALNITGIAITGANSADYAQTNTCGSSGAVTSCVISVAFTPTAPGTRTASISITDNASNSPQTITLTGTGLQSLPGPPSANGLWIISKQSNSNSPGITILGQILQSGTQISGTLNANDGSINNGNDQCPLSISGSVIGSSVTINAFYGNQLASTMAGSISSDSSSMTGTYTSPNAFGCGISSNSPGGNWSAALVGAGQPLITGGTSAASFDPGQIASLGYVSLFGFGLADGVYTSADANYGTKLGPTEIFICASKSFPGTGASLCSAARIVFASPGQVNVVLPAFVSPFGQTYYVAARIAGVIDAGMSSGSPLAISMNSFAPSVFLAGSDCLTNVASPMGCGLQSSAPTAGQAERGIITDLAGNVVWSGNRARLGQYCTAWLTGLGANPTQFGGTIGTLVPAYGYPNPSGADLNVTYSGAVPQYPGLYQVNFQIPLNIGEGPFGYGAWPCGNYNWELPMVFSSLNTIQIPLAIKNGDVPCVP